MTVFTTIVEALLGFIGATFALGAFLVAL